MLKPENFIYFFTVCGFFIGLIFSIIAEATPVDFLVYTLEITLFFYLFIHVVVMNFVDVQLAGKKLFDYKQYEEISAYFIHEIQERERRMETLIDVDAQHEPNVVHNMMRDHGRSKKKAA
ncbi:MAG: hypothetical protein IBX45_09010 [Campylobacterales bacterium]|nr:hypothetical protein [Campylobacterales bacterium]